MSVIGPRPQLVRDMVFMSPEQRRRHTAKPGLSGLAQVNGRNAISWEDKLQWDQKYIENISFTGDRTSSEHDALLHAKPEEAFHQPLQSSFPEASGESIHTSGGKMPQNYGSPSSP